jgi:hypothetical protein
MCACVFQMDQVEFDMDFLLCHECTSYQSFVMDFNEPKMMQYLKGIIELN